MAPTDRNVSWVVEQFSTLAWMVGFPDTDEKLTNYARLIARMIQGKKLIWVDRKLDPENRSPTPDGHIQTYLKPVEGVETDLDWIVYEIGRSCERFPMPVQVFRMYSRYFPVEGEEQIRAAQAALEGE